MKKLERYIACAAIAAAAMWVPQCCLAAASKAVSATSPFDGTWHTNMAEAKISPKPNVFYIGEDWYHCTSCSPEVTVKADGQDHPVTGQSYDSLSVRQIDANSIELTAKKDGKVMFEQTRAVSANGKTLTVKTTSHPMNSDQTVVSEVTASRVGTAPSGVHATSGDWKIDKVKESDNGTTETYKTNGDEITMSDPTGETFTAKLDGQDYPVKGSYAFDTVSLKKVDAHTIEETMKRGATVVEVNKLTVNGRTMKIESTNKLTDRTSTFVATKKEG